LILGRKPRKQKRAKEFSIALLGRHVPAINTSDGIRALNKTKSVDPGGVERYLEGKFGKALPVVREAMTAKLADTWAWTSSIFSVRERGTFTCSRKSRASAGEDFAK
jgi:hypothetical protein